MPEKCVCCGAVIPEGRQVCPSCENKKAIYAEDLIQVLRDDININGANLARVRRHIEAAPAVDAMPVVLCRDCEHFTEGMAIGMCKRNPDKPIVPMPYNAFCSFGERKDIGND